MKSDKKLKEGEKAEYGTFTPQPSFAMLIDKFPFFIVEICSDETYESDRWQMLLYAAAVLRAYDTHIKHQEIVLLPDEIVGDLTGLIYADERLITAYRAT